MLDKDEPPSSVFCVSGDKAGEISYNTAGDIVASKLTIP